MRIIGGKLKRKSLLAPKGELTRPTTDRVRESVFNLLYSRVDLLQATVLDMFAGTGALGFEALSRGAQQVTFIEQQSKVLAIARKNAAQLGVENNCLFYIADAITYMKRYTGAPFDVIFADPPYDLPELPLLPDIVLPHIKENGRFVLEHDTQHHFDAHPAMEVSRPYGRTIVTIFDPMLKESDVS